MIHPSLLKKQRITLLILILAIVATIFISLGLGASSLSYNRLMPSFLGSGSFKEEFVLYSIRLPRIIITFLSGIALALSGAILQGITRNDLADPGIIGINSGAGVAIAVFFLYFPIEAGSFTYLIPFFAFIGAIITFGFIYFFSYDRTFGFQPTRLVLVGVGFSMALSGFIIVLISSADRAKVDFIATWLAGNIWGDDWIFIYAILPWLIILIPFTMFKAYRLDLLGLSEPVTVGLGVSISKERSILFIAAIALAAAAVSAAGSIVFIGLMAPHIAKALVGPRNQVFLPVAMLIGGMLLLLADTIGRNIIDPNGIPVGIMVALIGGPYFIFLLLKK
ncbi:FecCD family ABC transporter permease [Niallia sp. 01092]|uniref:FecCD family ABC transporter permease n=1 Tax=unclassified Niallia TaxID=2837522 RepID=UPI003FCF4EA0